MRVLIFMSVLLAGCDGTADCPDGATRAGDRCVPLDAGPSDSGRDTNAPDTGEDAGACSTACTGSTPHCDETSMTCVACLVDGHCAPEYCVDNACVACRTNADCPVGMPVCGTENECGACTVATDCADRAATPACEVASGGCVECAATTDCESGETCNLLTFMCEDEPLPALRTCEACTNDDQCPMNHRCIRMQYMDVDRDPGHYCLLEVDAPGDCPNPFTVPTPIDRASINGALAEAYCSVDEALTSCEAVRGLLDDWRCDVGVDDRCYPVGEPGMAIDAPGARCEDLAGGAVTNRCTYSCGGVANCAPSAPGNACGPGSTAEANYCGG